MAKQYKIKITPYANQQMKEIRDYIANQLLNPDAARNIILKIRETANSLSSMPDRIRTIDEEPWGSQGIRKISVKQYLVYYWIEEMAAVVHVIAVAYAMQDQTRVLKRIRD